MLGLKMMKLNTSLQKSINEGFTGEYLRNGSILLEYSGVHIVGTDIIMDFKRVDTQLFSAWIDTVFMKRYLLDTLAIDGNNVQ